MRKIDSDSYPQDFSTRSLRISLILDLGFIFLISHLGWIKVAHACAHGLLAFHQLHSVASWMAVFGHIGALFHYSLRPSSAEYSC